MNFENFDDFDSENFRNLQEAFKEAKLRDSDDFSNFDIDLLTTLMNEENFKTLQEAFKEAKLRDFQPIKCEIVKIHENLYHFIPARDVFYYELKVNQKPNKPLKLRAIDLL